jgi:RNA polymerase sigma-70 factor (ECF subfamily)
MTPTADPLTVDFLSQLRAFVRKRVRGDADADDIVQDVLHKLVGKGEHVPDGSVHAWLFTVARRAVIDRFRTTRESAEFSDDLMPAETPADDGAVATELARCLDPMMTGLRDDERAILARVDMAGESQADIARELGVSVSAVKSRVQRARARLKGLLEACCAVEQDRRGRPIDYTRKPGTDCPCGAAQGDAPATPCSVKSAGSTN